MFFLYGFDDPSERPLVASLPLKRMLEERYRREHLGKLCDGPPCSTDMTVNWRDMVAAIFVRGIYLFAVSTTVEQDRKFVQDFNSREAGSECANEQCTAHNSKGEHNRRRGRGKPFRSCLLPAVLNSVVDRPGGWDPITRTIPGNHFYSFTMAAWNL